MKSESVVYYHYQKAFILESSLLILILNAENQLSFREGLRDRETERQTDRGGWGERETERRRRTRTRTRTRTRSYISRNDVKPQLVWNLHHLGASVIARRPIKQGHGIYIYTYYMTQPHPQQILSLGPSLSNMESSELISSQELKHPVGENNRVCI